ncbi:ATP-dependent DNA helicase RecQ [Klebsiella michiganensis]|nr:ATP-dependent DNA helicase RecQ [Klebsiella michiganensis]
MAQAEVLNQESLAKQVLQETFGYQQFRPGQETIIDTALAGRDCLVVMPTGGGKSLCYQVPALVLGRSHRRGVAAYFLDEGPGRSAAG